MSSADPAVAPPRSSRWPALAFGIAATLLLLIVAGPSGGLINRPFPGFLVWNNGVLVSLHRASWTGPQAGLPLNGGVVRELDGAPFEGGASLWEAARSRPLGSPIRVAVEGMESRIFEVPTMRLGTADFMLTLGIYLLNAIALFAVGGMALWLRPDLSSTRALAGATGVLAALLVLAVDYVTTFRLGVLCRMAEGLAPAALVNLALAFPAERLTRTTRRRITVALGGLGIGFENSGVPW